MNLEGAAVAGGEAARQGGGGAKKGVAALGAEAMGPAASYAQQFKLLGAKEQQRRVDAFAKMSLSELEHLEVLRSEAKEAIFQVRA